MSTRGLVAFLVLAAVPALAHGAPRGEAKLTLEGGKLVTVDYGRPSLNGRDMLGRAEPGTPWRMGADKPTTLTTQADLAFGEARVVKGTYVLTATKGADGQWTLNVANEDKTKVASVPLSASTGKDSVETFTIELSGEKDKGEIDLIWGTTILRAAFSLK